MGKLKDWWTYNQEKEEASLDSVHKPLTEDKLRSGSSLLILGFTWGFLITGLLIGGQIGPKMPFLTGTVPAILIGTTVLFIVASLIGLIGYKIRGTNDMVYQFAYGKYGRWLPGIFLIVITMGFQGIIVGGAASFIINDTSNPAYFWVALVLGLIFTYTAYRGISAIEKVANPSMILLVGISFFALLFSIREAGGFMAFNNQTIALSSQGDGPMGLAMASNLVIGSWIAGALFASDFTRFAKSKAVAIGLCFTCLFVSQILLIVVGAVGAAITGTHDFTVYLTSFSPIVGILAIITMILAMWTTSNTNLYFPAAQVAIGFKRPFKVAVLILGLIATLMGAFGFFNVFTGFINWIGNIMPAIAGPIIADFWLIHRTKYESKHLGKLPKYNAVAIIAACVGIVFTFSATGISSLGIEPVAALTSSWIIPAVLGLVVSIVAYVIIHAIFSLAGRKVGYSSVIAKENSEEQELEDISYQEAVQ